MKKLFLALAVAFAMSTVASAAEQVKPESTQTKRVKLTKAELEKVTAGIGDNWTTKKRNNGGNEPNGNANGVPTVNVNPGGNEPPGQN